MGGIKRPIFNRVILAITCLHGNKKQPVPTQCTQAWKWAGHKIYSECSAMIEE